MKNFNYLQPGETFKVVKSKSFISVCFRKMFFTLAPLQPNEVKTQLNFSQTTNKSVKCPPAPFEMRRGERERGWGRGREKSNERRDNLCQGLSGKSIYLIDLWPSRKFDSCLRLVLKWKILIYSRRCRYVCRSQMETAIE